MNQPIRKLLASLFFLNLTLSAAEAEMKLIYPAPNSWVYRSDYLVLKTNDITLTGLTLKVNGTESDLIPINSSDYRRLFQDILIVQPVWDKGKNVIIIDGYKDKLKVQTITADIFFNPSGDRSIVPAGFIANVIHSVEGEKLCAPCHQMSSEAKGPTSGASSLCAPCHKKLSEPKFPHEPVAAFTCDYCHKTSGSPRFAVTRRDKVLCYDCHANKAEEIKKFKLLHGPVAAGYCEVCHDPHGTDNPAFLRAPINVLCLSCHEKIAKTPHVLNSDGRTGHPLEGKKDRSPKRIGKELSCASCHDPHGGMFRYFLVSNAENRMALCQYCHAK